MGQLEIPKVQIILVGKETNLKNAFYPDGDSSRRNDDDGDEYKEAINEKEVMVKFLDFDLKSSEPPKNWNYEIPSVAIFIYDAELKKSFDEINSNYEILNKVFPNIKKGIIGFKVNPNYEKKVTDEEVEKIARKFDFHYLLDHLSAAEGTRQKIIAKVLDDGCGCCNCQIY